ncbi:MAG TPA: hypothetical protein PLT35_12090, partial [Vicinamibacterales bacterium]|nr:hypothetical protein [Vicinamibacterales bacterium]
RGEALVVDALAHAAELAAAARVALLDGDAERFSRLLDENFDTRRRIYALPPWQIAQVEAARACGASAQFAGSGGAIVGVYRDAGMLARVRAALEAVGSRTIVPQIAA